MRGRKTYILIIILVVFISIGFAILTANLSLNAQVGFKESSWDVHFDNVEVNSESSEETAPTLSDKNTSLKFDVTINEPGESYEFTVDVVNAGTMDAVLESFVKSPLTPEQEEVIDYTVRSYGGTDLKTNTVLHAGYKEKILVRVEYKYDVRSLSIIDDLNCSLQLNYVKKNLEKEYENETWLINYTGTETQFNVPKTGTYKLEVWGAQGLSNSAYPKEAVGGYGAYATGEITLTKNTSLYINVGQKGQRENSSFNGGGYGQLGGGGATHISTKSGLLSSLENTIESILIVAGGGGGNDTCKGYNISAGGIKGRNGAATSGGGQEAPTTTGATIGSFGQGGASPIVYNQENNYDSGGGGGAGFYGGDASKGAGDCGAGGSSYIGNKLLTEKVMYCYQCTTSDVEETKTETTNNVSIEPISQYAKIGNGFVKITLLKD